VVATVYVSEKNADRCLSILTKEKVKLLSHFVDAAYKRCSYCVGGPGTSEAIIALAMDALERIDLRMHIGSHPRLGVVDHVSCHPLGSATMEDAVHTAHTIANALSTKIPVLLYGGAHEHGRTLAETRRLTSYFQDLTNVRLEIKPDLGPHIINPSLGLLCCGAVPHVLNYNIQLSSDCPIATAKKIASAIRTRQSEHDDPFLKGNRRLLGVEALALHHDNQIEIACNLLDADTTPPSAVLDRVTRAALHYGTEVTNHYVIGRTKAELFNDLNRAFPSSTTVP